jgi:hypothetical protein
VEQGKLMQNPSTLQLLGWDELIHLKVAETRRGKVWSEIFVQLRNKVLQLE